MWSWVWAILKFTFSGSHSQLPSLSTIQPVLTFFSCWLMYIKRKNFSSGRVILGADDSLGWRKGKRNSLKSPYQWNTVTKRIYTEVFFHLHSYPCIFLDLMGHHEKRKQRIKCCTKYCCLSIYVGGKTQTYSACYFSNLSWDLNLLLLPRLKNILPNSLP